MAAAHIDPQRGLIIVSGTVAELRYINRIPGAKCQADNTFRVPLTLDSCTALIDQHVILDADLAAYADRQRKVQRYIEAVKTKTDPVEPLQPIPIKEPYHLYQHQVKAYNIALALFGRGARRST